MSSSEKTFDLVKANSIRVLDSITAPVVGALLVVTPIVGMPTIDDPDLQMRLLSRLDGDHADLAVQSVEIDGGIITATDRLIVHGEDALGTNAALQVPGFPGQLFAAPLGTVGYNLEGTFGPLTFQELADLLITTTTLLTEIVTLITSDPTFITEIVTALLADPTFITEIITALTLDPGFLAALADALIASPTFIGDITALLLADPAFLASLVAALGADPAFIAALVAALAADPAFVAAVATALEGTSPTLAGYQLEGTGIADPTDDPTVDAFTRITDIDAAVTTTDPVWIFTTTPDTAYKVELNTVARDPVSGEAYASQVQYLVNQGLAGATPDALVIIANETNTGAPFDLATITATTGADTVTFAFTDGVVGSSISCRINVERTPDTV